MKTQRLVAVIALLVVVVGLSVTEAAPSFAATRLSVAPTNPVAREYITIAGRFGTAIQRPVLLQYKTSSGWKSLDNKATASTGKFVFKTRAVAPSRTFRVFAPRFRKNGRTYSSVASASRTVRTVKPTSSFRIAPAPIGQLKADPSKTDLTPMAVRFTPARVGRKIVLQRAASGSWQTVAAGAQDRLGSFTFNIKAASGQQFRAVAVAKNGAPAVRSIGKQVAHLTQSWNDEFSTVSGADANGLNPQNWTYRKLGERDGKNRACSQSSTKSVKVRYGRLELKTIEIEPEYDLLSKQINPDFKKTEAECPNGQYYNGHIASKGASSSTALFDFKYGVMAARIKVQPSRGHHGGFWSNPTSSPATGAEIDALEYYGDTFQLGAIQHTIYREGVVQDRVVKSRSYLLPEGKKWSNDYHIFSVEWTPSGYTFRIDGTETFRTTKAVSEVEQYLILSLLSSDYELEKSAPSSVPMYVDWVRVWQ